jgi:hypothetical protein
MTNLGAEAVAPFTPDELAALDVSECITPVPDDAGVPSFKLPGRGEPDCRYAYKDKNGALLGCILRWNARDGSDKEIRPATFWRNGSGGGAWRLKIWPDRRPLYGLDRLAAHPDAIVLLTEGETAAEAVARGPLADAFTWANKPVVGLTWPGGVEAVKHADFSPLAGRDVIIVPDNDAPGEKAADQLVEVLHKAGVRRLRRWKAPAECAEGWDIADEPPAEIAHEALVGSILKAREIIPPRLLQPLSEFLADFEPPDYLLDGILQRRFVYSLTAQTGHGKTALALLIARLVGGSGDAKVALGRHTAEKGRVVYFAGENPDDLRMRVIGDAELCNDDKARIWFIPGTFSIEGMRAKIETEMKRLGGVDLIIVDTSAAYFNGKDELSNTEMGAHARLLRTLTTLPGGPCVLVLCHPVKHVTELSQLLPRGGGAFLAEVDGNLTLWKHDGTLLDLHHSDKLRGPGFEPISLRLETITTTRLTDKKGRLIPTVRAVWISDDEIERETEQSRSDEDALLQALLIPSQSIADLATACGWQTSPGEPHKSKVHRVMKRLATDKLVIKKRGTWKITDAGRKTIEAAPSEGARRAQGARRRPSRRSRKRSPARTPPPAPRRDGRSGLPARVTLEEEPAPAIPP